MKYLFFDTECSNCYQENGKLIEFGYCLTDEHFQIIKKDVLQMSPGKGRDYRFDHNIYKRDPSFQWAWDEDSYFECEELPYFYNKIKTLLEDKETIVFGFAVDNDIRYVADSVARYKLEPIDYICYDVQILMQDYIPMEKNRSYSLRKAFLALCSSDELINLQEHLSRDDAVMTMRITEELCKKLDISLNNLLAICINSKYNAIDYFEKYKQEREERRKQRKERRPRKSKSKNQILWGDLYRKDKPKTEDETYIGKYVTLSGVLKNNNESFINVCNLIKEKDYVAYDEIGGSDYLICLDEDDIQRMKSLMHRPYGGKMITVNQFEKL